MMYINYVTLLSNHCHITSIHLVQLNAIKRNHKIQDEHFNITTGFSFKYSILFLDQEI